MFDLLNILLGTNRFLLLLLPNTNRLQKIEYILSQRLHMPFEMLKLFTGFMTLVFENEYRSTTYRNYWIWQSIQSSIVRGKQ